MQVGRTTIPDKLPEPGTDVSNPASGPAFDQLVAAAQAEADRRAQVAKTTGATADKFSDQAWLAIIKAHGGEIGLSAQANAISKDAKGQLVVSDSVARARIMAFRNDPLVVSIMAAKRAGDGRAVLTRTLGRAPTETEMKVVESLGVRDAGTLLKAQQTVPKASAALVLPDLAPSKRDLFYRPDGSPRTINEVISTLTQPRDSGPVTDAQRLATSHMSFANPTSANPAMAALQAQAAADAKARPYSAVSTKPPAPVVSPDIDLAYATLGQVSIPGSVKGQTAPTGAKVSGWRGQMTSQVTDHLTHPETTVRNAPSNVTVAADPYASPRPPKGLPPEPTRPVALPALPKQPPLAAKQVILPTVRPPQPVAATPAAMPPPAATPAAPLALGPQTAPPAALPPAQRTPTPVAPSGTMATLQPLPAPGTAAPVPVAPEAAPPATPSTIVTAALEPLAEASPTSYVRASRYGPQSGTLSPVRAPAATSDAASAGIRPSRFAFASQVAVQQQASATPQPAMVTRPPVQALNARPVLGPDGLPLLPPVPGSTGLTPVSASDILRSPQQAQLPLSATRPLDLAPDAPVVAAPDVPQPVTPARRAKPHTIPGRF